MTGKIFYEDAYTSEFTARVAGIVSKGDMPGIILDQTAFYPGGGGQLHDTGYIGEHRIQEVIEEEGTILHLCHSPLHVHPGDEISCRVDWDRRYFSMQSHTAQHLISGILENQFDISTVSIHLSEDYFAIEIDQQDIRDELIAQALEIANQAIREAHPVNIHSIPADQLKNYPIRKYPQNVNPLRVIEIESIDWSACGGTHVKNTSEVQIIAYLGRERIRKRWRLKYTCGIALLKKFHVYFDLIQNLKVKFTCDEDDILKKVIDLSDREKELKKTLKDISMQWLDARLKSAEDDPQAVRFIEIFPDIPLESKKILNRLKEEKQHIICYQINPEIYRFAFISNIPVSWQESLAPLLNRKVIQGGGNPFFFQGRINGEMSQIDLIDLLQNALEENIND